MNSVQLDEKNNKVEPFFHRLSKLAANVENGVKEVQNKISLPKSDIPENSALIASVQVLDSLLALKKDISNTEEELDKAEHSRWDFIDSFQKTVKDTERKIDELENTLKKYGYVPWEPPHSDTGENKDQDKSNSENKITEEDVTSQATEMLSAVNGEKGKKSDNERSCTPEYTNRSLAYILRNSTNKCRNGSSRYNADDITPQLKLRSSCMRQPTNQLRTPVCFSDDVVCTPGLFIPFQQTRLRNGTLMNPDFCEPTFFASNRRVAELGNMYSNQQSPQFYEEDITVELFKKVKVQPSYSRQGQKESVTPEEPALHTQHIIKEIQKSTIKKKTASRYTKREESITPEEPVLHSQHIIEEIQKSTIKKKTKREESITPEEPVLHSQQLIEGIQKSTKKNVPFQTRLPIKDENVTPEPPKLKSLHYLRKSKIYNNLLQ